MASEILPHLMFDGDAKQAMLLYLGLFPDSEIIESTEYTSGENKGKLQFGRFSLNGQTFNCIDSPVKHDFGFTPAFSIFVNCESVDELSTIFKTLAEGGQIHMPLDNYGFSQQFGWLQDRFGVSWQLNFP